MKTEQSVPKRWYTNSDAGKLPRRKHTTFRTRRKFEIRCYVHYGDLILREIDYIVIISFGYIS
jgi:hypothetical protein